MAMRRFLRGTPREPPGAHRLALAPSAGHLTGERGLAVSPPNRSAHTIGPSFAGSPMSPTVLLACVLAYFALLYAVAWFTGRHADAAAFFVGGRRSHWLLVAFGMIGTSLSGVTFISVPGAVGGTGFTYFQIVFGQFFGYLVVAFVLLPLYYRLQVVSIYDVLRQRLGPISHRTGAAIFLVSRTLGATARLYLVVAILQQVVLGRLGVPFAVSATVLLGMILAYTYQGGVKTIVWTDTLQTAGMLVGLVVCIAMLSERLGLGLADGYAAMRSAELATWVNTVPQSHLFWAKQFIAGILIALAMTGVDQEMMQKNISVRTLRGAQMNMVVMSLVMLAVVALFLYLGGLLHLFANGHDLDAAGDRLFPAVVLDHLPAWVQIVFVIALISALFPSADGAITALVSSTCIDLIGIARGRTIAEQTRLRHRVHLAYAALFLALVLVFRAIDSTSMIGLILKIAGYTYGPLLGLFAFAVFSRRRVDDAATPWVALAAPSLCALIDAAQGILFGRWQIGLELLLLNAVLTYLGLWWLSRPARTPEAVR